jgi:hypothetical protein
VCAAQGQNLLDLYVEKAVLLPGHSHLEGLHHEDLQYKMSDEHSHSNLLLDRNVREVENKKIKVAAVVPSMVPLTILGDINVNLEENMASGTAFNQSKQSITKAVHRKRLSVKGFPSRPKPFEDLESLPSQMIKTTDNMPFLMLDVTVVTVDTTPRPRGYSSS